MLCYCGFVYYFQMIWVFSENTLQPNSMDFKFEQKKANLKLKMTDDRNEK